MPPRPKHNNRYDWDDKKDICYKLYVEERRSLRGIVKYFSELFNVPESELPGYAVFARQFTQKWNFPSAHSRKMPPETEAEVVVRMTQMWEQNLSVAETRKTLEDEGYELSKYDFRKLRAKHGMSHRAGHKYEDATQVVHKPKGRKRAAEEAIDAPAEEERVIDGDRMEEYARAVAASSQPPTNELSPEEAARRAERLAQIQIESDQRLSTRKRRRRIRGFGHLPPDAPDTAPRYASETSLDECKAFLLLDNDLYSSIRKQFEVICLEMDIERKKTSLDDGRWQTSKDRLVRENMHLSAVMHPLQSGLEQKAIGLDNICTDVTKRMRSMKTQMTIPEANNLLGLNPGSSKEVRRVFYEILENDHYTTRLACGDVHWQELRQQWYDLVPLLQNAIMEQDPQKNKAIDLLARDASKRYSDNNIKSDPSRRQHHRVQYGPGPGAAKHQGRKLANRITAPPPLINDTPTAAQALAALQHGSMASLQQQQQQVSNADGGDGLIDPALQDTLTASLSAASPTVAPPQQQLRSSGPAPLLSIPAYFRLAPTSQLVGNHPRIWLGRLTSSTLPALHAAATSKAGAARVVRVQGIVKHSEAAEGDPGEDSNAGFVGEDSYQIDGDDELAVYLEAAGDKATFVVTLEGGYA